MIYALRRRSDNKVQLIADSVQIIIATGQISSKVLQGATVEAEVFLVAGQVFPTSEFYADPLESLPVHITTRGIL